MIKPTKLNKYTMILMKQVIKKVNNGEITIKELSKKTGYKISSINSLLKGHFINFQEATKLCKAFILQLINIKITVLIQIQKDIIIIVIIPMLTIIIVITTIFQIQKGAN